MRYELMTHEHPRCLAYDSKRGSTFWVNAPSIEHARAYVRTANIIDGICRRRDEMEARHVA